MVVNILVGIYVGSFAFFWLGSLAAGLDVKATAKRYGLTPNGDGGSKFGRLLVGLMQSLVPGLNTLLALVLILRQDDIVDRTLEKYYD